MTPKIGEQDEFEGLYTEKFRNLAKPYGEFIKYERDRAAIDIGLHLTNATSTRYRNLSFTKIWIQLKGVRKSTLSLKKFRESKEVVLNLEIDHLKFWYASPEAVYLIIYIESADVFLAEDIRDIVSRQWEERIFYSDTFRPNQKKASVKVSTGSILNDDTWQRMLSHRSLRIDGPSFRGRPLGHRLDPLRCIPNQMEPAVFSQMVNRLLEVHGFKEKEVLDPRKIFPNADISGDIASLRTGVLHYTYEWVPQFFTEFGFGKDDDFREEGRAFHIQGPCAVLIHSHKESKPDRYALKKFAQEMVSDKNVSWLLVFVNDNDDEYFGAFGVTWNTGMDCLPQLLRDIAFNLLTATTVYLEFRDKISWKVINYLY